MPIHALALTISEGALVNILARAKAPLVRAAEPIAAAVRQSAVVGSDETTARVAGKTWWQWVLLGSTAICHVIVPSRAAAVVEDFLDGHRPQIWVADRYAAQTGHGAARQLCLAHLRRDAQYAIDAGDSLFAFGFKLLLLRAMAIGRRRPTLKPIFPTAPQISLINQLLARPIRKWGKSPGGFGEGLHRSVGECQKMAEFRAYRSDPERMLHLRARTFAPLTPILARPTLI